MNQEIKAQWVAALRSGEYEQGDSYLCKTVTVGTAPEGEDPQEETRYCCLGVLCDLAVKAGVTRVYQDDPDDGVSYGDRWDNNNTHLPDVVVEWAELEGNNPYVESPEEGLNSLTWHNDSGQTFERIADMIEAQL